MNQLYIIPELNYWIDIVLKNTPVGDTFQKIPVKTSGHWVISNSVLSLLFNENFNPETEETSSSSGGSRNYIYLYRLCNLSLITDKLILNRVQTYRWHCSIFACDNKKFIDIFDTTHSHYPPTQDNPTNIIYDSGLDYLEESAGNIPTLPYDVEEKYRSPFITYKTKTLLTSNYQLVKNEPQLMRNWPPTPIISNESNIFNFTVDDILMLDSLYDYKVDGICNLDGIIYDDLDGVIAQLIYCYLEAFTLNVYDHFNSETPISDETNILSSIYEKFILDQIYQLRERQYGVIWQHSDIVNNEIVKENIDQFLIMKKENMKIVLTQDMIDSGEILLDTENLPWDKKDFVLYKDGLILQGDIDYKLVLDFSIPTNIIAKIILIKKDFIVGENILLIWSFVEPYATVTPIVDDQVDQ